MTPERITPNRDLLTLLICVSFVSEASGKLGVRKLYASFVLGSFALGA